MKLWFENRYGEWRVIKEHCATRQDVIFAIREFIEECNRKWPNKKPFEWYYTRNWVDDKGHTWFDIGSHTEFFIWEGREE